jgi:peptidoglycan hydrolase CwlO-like protein
MPDDNGQSRLDRIEAIIEATATSQADIEDEFRRLLRAQVVMADSIRELAAAQHGTESNLRELAAAHRNTESNLNALIAVVDDIVRKRPPSQAV